MLFENVKQNAFQIVIGGKKNTMIIYFKATHLINLKVTHPNAINLKLTHFINLKVPHSKLTHLTILKVTNSFKPDLFNSFKRDSFKRDSFKSQSFKHYSFN